MTFFKTKPFKEQGSIERFTGATAPSDKDYKFFLILIQWYVRRSNLNSGPLPNYLLPRDRRIVRNLPLFRYRHLYYLLLTMRLYQYYH